VRGENKMGREVVLTNEAIILQLAPTSSTTATLAMGDALAVALMRARNFKPEDFAMLHPGGSLGRRLLSRVRDVMTSANLPVVTPDTPFNELIDVMTRGRLGLCVVVDVQTVVGLITDGDLRRALSGLEKTRFDFLASEIMTKQPKIISPDAMASEAEEYMLQHKIKELLVVENDALVGVVQLYDMGK